MLGSPRRYGDGAHVDGAIHEHAGLVVTVDDVVLMPGLDAPADKPFAFVYFISIRNESDVAVVIRGRKWVILEHDGSTTVVEGDGVVGRNPRIEPGGCFSYNSYHVVAGSARASGAFFGETADGQRLFARIPEFRMRLN